MKKSSIKLAAQAIAGIDKLAVNILAGPVVAASSYLYRQNVKLRDSTTVREDSQESTKKSIITVMDKAQR